MLDALGELEVAAVVDGPGVHGIAGSSRPAGRSAVAPESVDHDVAPDRTVVLDHAAQGAARTTLILEEADHACR